MTASPAPAANALQPVSVIVFPGGFNWPIWIAQDKGYFARGGIEVALTPTPNSVFQLTSLIDGKFDIAMTAIDNVIAYMEGQGEAPTMSKPDLIVFMGGDNGFLSLVGIPEIKSISDLKGKTVSVDALTTGYAFVLLDLLKRAGLKQADYKIEKAGGVLARWEALKEKKHDATMLITPFDIFARNAGLNVLQYAIGVYGHYQAWHVAMWWVGGGWEGQDPPGCHRQLGSGADPVPGGDGLDLRQGRAKPVSGDPHRCRRQHRLEALPQRRRPLQSDRDRRRHGDRDLAHHHVRQGATRGEMRVSRRPRFSAGSYKAPPLSASGPTASPAKFRLWNVHE